MDLGWTRNGLGMALRSTWDGLGDGLGMDLDGLAMDLDGLGNGLGMGGKTSFSKPRDLLHRT